MRISDWSSDVCSSELDKPWNSVHSSTESRCDCFESADRHKCGSSSRHVRAGARLPRRRTNSAPHPRRDQKNHGPHHHHNLPARMDHNVPPLRFCGGHIRRQRTDWTCGRREERGSARNGCRSEEHTSELQSLMRNSYAVFCLKKKNKT